METPRGDAANDAPARVDVAGEPETRSGGAPASQAPAGRASAGSASRGEPLGLLERLPLALGLAHALLFLWFFARSIHPIPRWDFLDWVTGYLDAASVPAYLWRLHNEHRLVVTKLLVIADVELLGGRLAPLAWLALASLVAWGAIVVAALLRDGETPRGLRACIAGWALFVVFPTYSLDNYTYPTNLQLALVTFFFVTAVAALLRALPASAPAARSRELALRASSHSAAWLGGSLAAAAAASLSSANGLLAWPVLLVLAWRTGLPRRGVLAVAAAALVTTAVYLAGYATPGHAALYMRSADDLLRFLAYLIAYFGMPWVAVEALRPLGLAIGLATILLAAAAVASLVRPTRGLLGRREALALGLFLFAGGTALLTSFGRMHLGEPHPAHRYTIFAVVAQAGILLAAPTPLARLWSRPVVRRRLVTLPLALAPLLFLQQVWVGGFAVERARWFERLEDALRSGDRRPAVTRPIYPHAERLEHHLGRLAERGLYLYRPAGECAAASPACASR